MPELHTVLTERTQYTKVLYALQRIKFPVQRQKAKVIKHHHALFINNGFNLGEWQQQQLPPVEHFFLNPWVFFFFFFKRYFTQTGPILSVCEEGKFSWQRSYGFANFTQLYTAHSAPAWRPLPWIFQKWLSSKLTRCGREILASPWRICVLLRRSQKTSKPRFATPWV